MLSKFSNSFSKNLLFHQKINSKNVITFKRKIDGDFFLSQEVSYFFSLKNMDELYKVSLLTKQIKVFMIFQSLMKTMKVQCKNMTHKKVLMK